jgi:hypothetical protein
MPHHATSCHFHDFWHISTTSTTFHDHHTISQQHKGVGLTFTVLVAVATNTNPTVDISVTHCDTRGFSLYYLSFVKNQEIQEIVNLTASFPIHSGLDRNSKITCQGSSMFVLVGGAWCSFHGLLEPDMRWAFDLIGIYHWYISLVFIDINVSLGRKGGIREK